MKPVLIAILFCVVLMGCEQREKPRASTPAPEVVTISPNRMECNAGDDPFACVRQACNNAGAIFDEKFKTCSCKDGTLFFATFGGACIRPMEVDEKHASFQYSDKNPYYLTSDVSLHGLWKPHLKSRSIPLFPGQTKTALFTDVENLKTVIGYLQPGQSFGLPLTELPWTLPNSGFDHANAILRTMDQFYLIHQPRTIRLKDVSLQDWLNHLIDQEFTSRPSRVRSFTSLGCAEICVEKTLILEHQAYTAYRIRTFSGGGVFEDTISFFDKETSRVKALVSLYDGQPSHIFLTNEDGGIDLVTTTGEVIAKLQTDVPRRNASPKNFSNETPVVVFEGNYSQYSDQAVMWGPHPEASYYGWFKKEDERPFYYGKTVTLLGEEEYSPWQHSSHVTNLASNDNRKPIIPMSVTALTNGDFAKIIDRVPRDRFVVNFSAAFTFSADTCAQSEIGQLISQTKDKLLWVVGAGNQGSRISKSNLALCPQSLDASNLILVAATNGSQLSRSSSYGEDFADLAENGCEFMKERCDLGGTSYAAPRVARLTADLMSAFPQFSIEQIKVALMIMSKVPRDHRERLQPLPVRSGGVIDAQATRALLTLLRPFAQNFDLKRFTSEQMSLIENALYTAKYGQFESIQKSSNFKDEEKKKRILQLIREQKERIEKTY